MRFVFAFVLCVVIISQVSAQTCNMGYYNHDDQCIQCDAGYFCSGGVRTACGDATNGLYKNSDAGAYDVTMCYLITTPGKYVADWRGGLVDCATGYICPGDIRVYYGLPDGYRMTTYTTINNGGTANFNGVNTGVSFKESDAIDFAFSTTDNTDGRILFVASYGHNQYIYYLEQPYIASSGGNMYATGDFNAKLFPVYSRTEIGNGIFKSVRAEYSNTVSNPIYFGSWTDKEWSRTINWYGFKISKSGSALQNLIPCVRESDGVAGFYDTVGGAFYTNHEYGKIPFSAGPVADSYICPKDMYYTGRGICKTCPAGLSIPDVISGSQNKNDCGRTLRIGDKKLYLRSSQRTSPSIAVQIGDYILYGDMSIEKRGCLRTEYKGNIYSIFNMDIDK